MTKRAGFIAGIDLANMRAPKIEKRSCYRDELIRHAQEQKQENAGEA
jgi:hypothetical protein